MLDLGLLLAQLIVILLAARLIGRVVRLVGQAAVIGELIAGLALGPSVLGTVAPGAMQALFPATKMLPLATLSQLGVILFMFVVGLRLDISVLRSKASAAVAVSHASIVAPFLLGIAIAKLLHPDLAPTGVSFSALRTVYGGGDEYHGVSSAGAHSRGTQPADVARRFDCDCRRCS